MLSHCLGQKYLLFNIIIKERRLYSRKTFTVLQPSESFLNYTKCQYEYFIIQSLCVVFYSVILQNIVKLLYSVTMSLKDLLSVSSEDCKCVHSIIIVSFLLHFDCLVQPFYFTIAEVVLGHELTNVDEIHGQFEDISKASVDEMKNFVCISVLLWFYYVHNCMYMCMFVCVCVCVCMRVRACVNAWVCLCQSLCLCVSVSDCLSVCICLSVSMFICIYLLIMYVCVQHMDKCACVSMYMDTWYI